MEEAFKSFGPYQGASIFPKILDANTVEVTMPLVLLNTNYVGTHFGGSLYSMCDLFFMFILIENLGEDYLVWDKSARIEFHKPGTVRELFHIPDSEIEEIRSIIKQSRKAIRNYEVNILNQDNGIIATVYKELFICSV
ncbi:MAG: thioesterase, partial [Desulfobacterium sp.]|nr:thioesterase [Desulfobacterium sp.]